jgi:hypothetical protein
VLALIVVAFGFLPEGQCSDLAMGLDEVAEGLS